MCHGRGADVDDSVIDLQTRLGLKVPPIHIECTDIAHIQGVDPVASVVVAENGKLKKSEYRLFHIKEAMGLKCGPGNWGLSACCTTH